MKNVLAVAMLFFALVLGGSIIAALSHFHIFQASPRAVQEPTIIPSNYFGMTIHNYRTTTPWPSIPFASLRTWDTPVTWPDIHKGPDTFDWSALDATLGLAQKHGVDVLFTLGRTPRWASASPNAKSAYGPGQCAPPAKMQYWDEFIRAVLIHTAGKIRLWEIWNEPQSPDSISFYCGDVSTMVELQRRAYQVIKSFNPNATVLTPSAVGAYGPPWMARFLAGGGGQYADVMAFHGYLAPAAKAESVITTIENFKAVFADYGEEAKPVWDTEGGWGQNAWLSDPDQQAAFLAKFYILHWSAGIERFYWYAYDSDKWGTLWDLKGGLHQAGIAYGEVHRWLQGAILTSPCALKQSVWSCDLQRENGYRAMIVWSSGDASAPPNRITVPSELRQYRKLNGQLEAIQENAIPISAEPILVENIGSSLNSTQH